MTIEPQFSQTWDLDSLLPHPQTDAFAAKLASFRSELAQVAAESDRLPPLSKSNGAAGAWGEFLQRYAAVAATATDLASFVSCHAAAEAGNKQFQQLEATLASFEPDKERIATNVELALRPLSPDDLGAVSAGDPKLAENAFFLQDRRQRAGLRLPKELESLSADLAVDGIHAWGRLYDRVSGALRVRVMERGEVVEKSPGQVTLDSPERAVRENNFFAADKSWTAVADTCADALNHIAGTRLTVYKRLGLASHLDAPLRYNRMTAATLDAMWSAVTTRKRVLLKYLAKKAELLGLDRLAWYDLSAPLPQAAALGEQAISYDHACGHVLDTFRGFSPSFGKFAETALTNQWLEVENRAGKRQGGFCTWFPTARQSRIFMTYTNSADSMSTLAHELGHAYHSHVLKDRPFFLQDYPMNLAETASTFAEAVLNEERLKAAASRDERLVLLDGMLGDAVSYLMNIHARFLFEDRFHVERAAGEVPAARLSELMRAAQQDAFCDSLADDGWNPNFWVSKLHFYISSLPFYNFPYTFGFLLSTGVYALAADFGGQFSERYERLLQATGSLPTEQAVQSTLGYDLTEPTFWNRSLDVVERRVEQFLELANRPGER
ncbi:MAG TPA: M3 family oligoendopeptidase [Planctomycetaceae bacterium]|jgi:pepF/M3 family oligoendopeptidase|nr:M3 family oligoendopeptidase [Planctomycetaceae bacterium]